MPLLYSTVKNVADSFVIALESGYGIFLGVEVLYSAVRLIGIYYLDGNGSFMSIEQYRRGFYFYYGIRRDNSFWRQSEKSGEKSANLISHGELGRKVGKLRFNWSQFLIEFHHLAGVG